MEIRWHRLQDLHDGEAAQSALQIKPSADRTALSSLYYTREFCGSAHTHEAVTAILRWEAGLCQPEPKSESAIRLIWSDGVDSSWGSRPCLAAAGDAGSFTGCPIRRLR